MTKSVVLNKANLTITAADDGIQADDETDVNSGDVTINDSTVTITASDKGVTATDEVAVSGSSTVNVTAGDEGIEGRYINLTGGSVTVNAGDDGLNATEWTSKTNADTSSLTNTIADLENSVAINIDGANVTVVAGGDGIDSNGNVTVKSGSLYVTQTSADNAAIDYDGTGIISGGTVWAIGNQGMAQAFTTGSSQSYIIANVSGNAGDTITVTDSSGNVVAQTVAASSFGNVVFSTEALVEGEGYTITTSSGNSATATATEEGSNNGFGMGGPMGDPSAMGQFDPGTNYTNGSQPTSPNWDGTGTPPAPPTGITGFSPTNTADGVQSAVQAAAVDTSLADTISQLDSDSSNEDPELQSQVLSGTSSLPDLKIEAAATQTSQSYQSDQSPQAETASMGMQSSVKSNPQTLSAKKSKTSGNTASQNVSKIASEKSTKTSSLSSLPDTGEKAQFGLASLGGIAILSGTAFFIKKKKVD